MRIINRTNWTTRNLKTFIIKVCEKELLGQDYKDHLCVTFKYRRHRGSRPDNFVGGWAWDGTKSIEITFVKGMNVDKRQLAKCIAHELAHTQGVGHRTMHTAAYGWVDGWRDKYEWAEALPLERYSQVQPVASTPSNQALAKLASATTLLKAWDTKLRYAKNKVQKCKDQIKYYSKRVTDLQASNSITDSDQEGKKAACSQEGT